MDAVGVIELMETGTPSYYVQSEYATLASIASFATPNYGMRLTAPTSPPASQQQKWITYIALAKLCMQISSYNSKTRMRSS